MSRVGSWPRPISIRRRRSKPTSSSAPPGAWVSISEPSSSPTRVSRNPGCILPEPGNGRGFLPRPLSFPSSVRPGRCPRCTLIQPLLWDRGSDHEEDTMEDKLSARLDQLNHDYYLDCDFATRVIHAGEHFGEFGAHSHNSPIYQTSTFSFKSAKHGSDVFSGSEEGYMYTRLGNPTVKVLEAKMNAIEGREVKLRSPETRGSSL